jgi:hypothetical protein
MVAELTVEVFRAFVYGVFSLLGGGFLFKSGETFVKTAGGNQFKGKEEAIPFFFLVLMFGWVIQHLDPFVNPIIYSIPVLTRLGIMVFGAVLLFNYSVPNFNYFDETSMPFYLVGFILSVAPFL